LATHARRVVRIRCYPVVG